MLAIRKFQARRYTAEELLRIGAVAPDALHELRQGVEGRQNILISGGTGTGKTTLLNALAAFIPPEERIVVIEDTAEIQIQARNLVRLESRREHVATMSGAMTIRDLLRATLRLRPDRILLGEVRGGEAFDLLQALNTGHSGALATLHANSAGQALARFTTCVLQSGIELPYRAIQANIAEVLNLVVHVERRLGQRLVTQILRLNGYDAGLDRFDWKAIYERA